MESIIEHLQNKVASQSAPTIQVQVPSDSLVPSIDVVGGKRVLFLEFEGTKYECLDRGWTSWADKVLTPRGHKDKDESSLVDEETGRAKRWSTSTIRKFLEMTPTDITNKIVRSWWERHEPENWSVIKYADMERKGGIRYIGTPRYRLYRNEDFINDISATDFSGMKLRGFSLTEDHMVIRLTSEERLPINGVDVFAGFHLLNSENGSSSIAIKHMIYDLLCTNGLMFVFDKSNIIQQRHSKFDMEAFRQRVVDVSKELPKIHNESKELVVGLINRMLSRQEADAVLDLYETEYNATKSFIDSVEGRLHGNDVNAWQLISAITEESQRYNWGTRMQHEEHAGHLIRDIWKERHKKFIKAEA